MLNNRTYIIYAHKIHHSNEIAQTFLHVKRKIISLDASWNLLMHKRLNINKYIETLTNIIFNKQKKNEEKFISFNIFHIMNCNGNGQREARATKKLTLTQKHIKALLSHDLIKWKENIFIIRCKIFVFFLLNFFFFHFVHLFYKQNHIVFALIT